ncbi:MAG: branched-chain amino acid ABC transporter permease [Solirubrobacteraceae bacterium]
MQVILSGLAIGAVYGLVGMGFSIAFYVTRVINFAQGQLLMVAIMLTAALARGGVPALPAALIGIGGAAVMGVLVYLIAVRPVLSYSRFSFAWLVSTLGVAVVLENLAAIIWGPTSRSFPALLKNSSITIGSAHITVQEFVGFFIAMVLAGGFEVARRRTAFGRVGVAIAEDAEMASAIGANTQAYAVGAFALAGVFAGVAGILIGPLTYANPYLGDTYGIAGFVALMIGGTRRPLAAMGGGLLLGLLSQLATSAINPQASDWLPFVVVVIVLLVTPEGLFSVRLGHLPFLHRSAPAEVPAR